MISPNYLVPIVGFIFYLYMTGVYGILLAAVLLLLILALVYFKQNILLYIPSGPNMPKSNAQNPPRYRHPKEQNLEAIDLELTTADGVKIRGWHVRRHGAKRVVVYFHENAGNIGTRIPYLWYISKQVEADVILVAYRGYSDSDSVPSEQGIVADSKAILDYALDYANKSQLPLYVLGRSLGGAVTVNVASQAPYQSAITGVILQNTFTNISQMIDAIMPVFKYVKFLLRNFWPSIDRIHRVTCPILFIKSMRDELVPPQHMHRLMQAATGAMLVREYRIPDGTHNSSWDQDSEKYFGRVKDFFRECEGQKK